MGPDQPCSPPTQSNPGSETVEAGKPVRESDSIFLGNGITFLLPLVSKPRYVTAGLVEDVVFGYQMPETPRREGEKDDLPPVGNAQLFFSLISTGGGATTISAMVSMQSSGYFSSINL